MYGIASELCAIENDIRIRYLNKYASETLQRIRTGNTTRMARIPSLAALRAFDAAGRLGSIRQAALEIGINHTAVSRHLAALQNDLNCRLVRTSAQGLQLTKDGEIYAERVGRALEDLAAATALVRARGARESIHISCAPGLASRWLAPRLDRFTRNHRAIEICLRPTSALSDFSREQVDFYISYGHPHLHDAREIELCRPRWFPVASPKYIATHAPANTLHKLTQARLLHEDEQKHWHDWFLAAGLDLSIRSGGPRLWQADLVLDAATRGAGFGLTNHLIGGEFLADGRLVEPFATHVFLEPYVLSAPRHIWNEPIISRFRSWLVKEMNASCATRRLQTAS